jgi:hypothetical protein
VLREANAEIRRTQFADSVRRSHRDGRRRDVRRLDRWLGQIETLLERDRTTVPEPLVGEIADFLIGVDPKLHRDLVRNGGREAVRVLDVLFEAQETLLPRVVATRNRALTSWS